MRKKIMLAMLLSAMLLIGAFAGVAQASDPCVPCDCKCPLTQGYWKNHPDAWPVDSLTIGGTTYGKAVLIDILKTPPKGNGAIILAHQLIAAKLNVAYINNCACIPPKVCCAIGKADELIASATDGYLKPSEVSRLVEMLTMFNEGYLSGHCH